MNKLIHISLFYWIGDLRNGKAHGTELSEIIQYRAISKRGKLLNR